MSTEVTIGANLPGEAYIGEQDDILAVFPVITAWQPAGDKRDGQTGTHIEGTDLNAV